MRIASYLVIGFTWLASLWTISYHAVLIAQLPAYVSLVVFGIGFAASLPFAFKKCQSLQSRDWRRFLPICGVAMAFAFVAMVLYFPEDDNLSYFHRVLWQSTRMGEPFTLHSTGTFWGGGPLPPLSYMHLLSSYEPSALLLGFVTHHNPLDFYFLIYPPLIAFVGAITAYLFFLEVGVRPRRALLATALFALTFFLDGGTLRGFGGFGLTRIEEGKCGLLVMGVPLLLYAGLRFIRMRDRSSWMLAAGATVIAVGLSSTGIFLAPMAAFLLAVIGLLVSRKRDLKAAALTFGTSAYALAISAAFLFKVFPAPPNTSVWDEGWPTNWYQNLSLMVPEPIGFARNLLIVALCIVAVWNHKKLRLGTACYLGFAILLFFNPVSGAILMKVVHAGVYWRIGYLVHLPLALGMLVGIANFRSIGNWVCGAASALLLFTFGGHPLMPDPVYVHLKSPTAPRIRPEFSELSRQLLPYTKNKVIFCREEISATIGLLDPSAEFVVSRNAEIVHYFRTIGQPFEALRRLDAIRYLDGLDLASSKTQFVYVVAEGVDIIVAKQKRIPQLEAVLKGKWKVISLTPEYGALLRR